MATASRFNAIGHACLGHLVKSLARLRLTLQDRPGALRESGYSVELVELG
ncbi:hypothetical protein [Novosphingobium sp.]|nr:hypothetical protein [Novosphingobium sp.]